jgi:hypothetical protein
VSVINALDPRQCNNRRGETISNSFHTFKYYVLVLKVYLNGMRFDKREIVMTTEKGNVL